jgi:hypothetical protein
MMNSEGLKGKGRDFAEDAVVGKHLFARPE